MEAYLVSVFISSVSWVVLSVAALFLLLFTKKYHPFPPFKVFFVLLLLSIGVGMIQPSNTFKFEAQKEVFLPPKIESKRIEEIPPIIEQGKEERARRFEDLTDWRSKYGN